MRRNKIRERIRAFNLKKRAFMGITIAMCIAMIGSVGCSSKQEKSSISTTKKTSTEKLKIKDYLNLKKLYVLEGSKGIDFEKFVTVKKEQKSNVVSVKADDSKVDYERAGKYPVTYKVEVRVEDSVEELEASSTVEVVTSDRVEDLLSKGEVVIGTDGKPIEGTAKEEAKEDAKEDAKVEEGKEVAKNETKPAKSESAESKPSTSKPSASKPSTSKPSQPSTSKPSQPSKPAHTHNWQPHTAYRDVYKTVDDYKTVTDYKEVGVAACNTCGEDVRNSAHASKPCSYDGYHVVAKKVPCGTHQEKIGSHQEKVGTEPYTDYYYCSCGARK